MRASPVGLACTASILAVALIACHDNTGPLTGVIQVAIVTRGTGVDTSARYALSVDGGPPQVVRISEIVTLSNLKPGEHHFSLTGLTVNCTLAAGANPRSVMAEAGKNVWTEFDVTCVPLVGRVRVTTVTTGPSPDPDGYTVNVGGGESHAIAPNGVVTFENVPVGQHDVMLEGMKRNCTTQTHVTANVAFAAVVDVRFDVVCQAPGTLQVTTATSGVDLDPDGYVIVVEAEGFSHLEAISASSTTTIADLAPGDYRVTLFGVAANCDVGSNPRTITIDAGAQVSTSFALSCARVTQLAYASDVSGNSEIYVINSNGTLAQRLTTTTAPVANTEPAWSLDGRKIAFQSDRDGNSEIYVMDADGSNVKRLTQNTSGDFQPTWSPDGRIAFVSNRDGNGEIYLMNADGSGQTRLTTHSADDRDPNWSPDGRSIAFIRAETNNTEIYVLDVVTSALTRLTTSSDVESGAAWSPDGRLLAFARLCLGGSVCGIYTMKPDGTAITLVTAGDFTEPTWSPDGSRIAFTETICDYYYYYGCSYTIAVVKTDGTAYVRVTNQSEYNPAWRR